MRSGLRSSGVGGVDCRLDEELEMTSDGQTVGRKSDEEGPACWKVDVVGCYERDGRVMNGLTWKSKVDVGDGERWMAMQSVSLSLCTVSLEVACLVVFASLQLR